MRMSSFARAAALVAVLGLPAAATAQMAASSMPASPAIPAAPIAAGVTPADYNFIMQAGFGGWGEVSAGQIARQRSSYPAVQSMAVMLVTDHMRANQQLASLAAAHGIAAPTAPDPARQTTTGMLQQLSGPAFDQAFVTEQVAEHQVAIALFQSEAASSADPGLRGFAQQQLPILHHHFEMLTTASRVASVR